MEFALFILTAVTIVTILNTLFIVAIAASVSKLIKSIRGEPTNSKETWSKIIQERKLAQMQDGNSPTYANNLPQPKSDLRHWDGLPRLEE